MWRMAGDTPFGLHGRMFVDKWSLFIGVTFNAGCVRTGGKSGLLQFETTMRVVAITTLHRAFKNLVMVRQIELVLDLCMAAQTKLGFTAFQQLQR